MTHDRLAPLMGLMMGAMIPLMVHGPAGGIGFAFVLGHVLTGISVLGLVLVVPRMRAWVGRRPPTWRMGGRMALGAGTGFVVICAYCLVTWHGTS